MGPISPFPSSKSPNEGTAKTFADLPNDLKIHLIKHLGVKALGNTSVLNRQLSEFATDPKRWVELAKNLKIRVSSPEKAKEEVTEYFRVLGEINELLLLILWKFPIARESLKKISDNVDKNQAIRKFIRENKNDIKIKEGVSFVNNLFQSFESYDAKAQGTIKVLLEERVISVANGNALWGGWRPVIYLGEFLEEYKKLVASTFNFSNLDEGKLSGELFNVIRHNKIEYAKFLLSQIGNPKQRCELILFDLLSYDDFKKIDPSLLKLFTSQLKERNDFMDLLSKATERVTKNLSGFGTERIAQIKQRAEIVKSAVLGG